MDSIYLLTFGIIVCIVSMIYLSCRSAQLNMITMLTNGVASAGYIAGSAEVHNVNYTGGDDMGAVNDADTNISSFPSDRLF